jgi:hypothetical protein
MKALAWYSLNVEELGGFLFRVESESHEGTHMVDALADNGLGICDCKNFQIEVAPVRAGKRRGLPNHPNACKHIMRVDLYMSARLKENVLKQKRFQTIDSP